MLIDIQQPIPHHDHQILRIMNDHDHSVDVEEGGDERWNNDLKKKKKRKQQDRTRG